MNNSELKRIEDRLRPDVAPEPPAGLLERIQEDIPGHLQVVPDPAEQATSRWKLQLLAASVVLVVVGGALVYRVGQQAPTLEESLLAEVESQTDPERVAPEEPTASIEMKEELAGKLEAVGRPDNAAKVLRGDQPPPRVQTQAGPAVDTFSETENDRPSSVRTRDEEGESRSEGNGARLEIARSEQPVVTVTSESPIACRGVRRGCPGDPTKVEYAGLYLSAADSRSALDRRLCRAERCALRGHVLHNLWHQSLCRHRR